MACYLGHDHRASVKRNQLAFGDLRMLDYLPNAASSTFVVAIKSSVETFEEAFKSLEKLIINQTLGRSHLHTIKEFE